MARNEIFISYSSKDRKLADKLYLSLHSEDYFHVFYDKEGLTAGDRWNDQLENELNNSNHLVVLWSSNSMPSQWVNKEVNLFKNIENHGLIIFICLDIDNETEGEFQSIKSILENNLYPNNIDTMDNNFWDKLVNNIRKSVYEKNGSKPIKRVVFTLTKEDLDKLDTIDNNTCNLIKPNYGTNYADWKPFGNKKTIENILDDYLYKHINQETKNSGTTFYWEDIDWKEPGSKLYLPLRDSEQRYINENNNTISSEIEKLKSKLCVLVIDPYALNNRSTKSLFDRSFTKCGGNKGCLVMALRAHQLSEDLIYMRNQLQIDATSFYESYFVPKMIHYSDSPDCYANTLDDLEVGRHLKMSLRNHITPIDTTNGGTFTRNRFH